jgi:hypothetical protein
MKDHCCSTNENTHVACPVCNQQGQMVSNFTVKESLENKSNYIEESNYYACFNPQCLVAYYDNQNNLICESAVRKSLKTKAV